MPVQGPNRNGPVLTSTTVEPNQPTTPTTPTTSNTVPRGNIFERGVNNAREAALPATLTGRTEVSMNSFHRRLREIFRHDAGSLAAGHSPLRAGDPLSDTQRDDLVDAAKELIESLPIGALSPTATRELKDILRSRGMSTDNLEFKTLDDLGDIGGDLAKNWAEELREEKPATFYGLLGGIGAAIGAYGYLEGSEALKDLGIKPKVSTKLFNDRVRVRAEAMWDKRFENANLVTDVNGAFNTPVSATSLRFRSHLDARNWENSHGDVGVRVGDDRTFIDGRVTANADGEIGYRVDGRYTRGNVSVHGGARLDSDLNFSNGHLGLDARLGNHGTADLDLHLGEDARPTLLEGNLRYERERFRLSAGARHDFLNDDTSVNLRADYTPTDNLEFGLRGGYSSRDGGNIGVGVTWNF